MARTHRIKTSGVPMNTTLIDYYEAIERASTDMLDAARRGHWNEVVKIEGACVVLIAKLREASKGTALDAQQLRRKSSIMQRILSNDAQIRHLVEPCLDDIDRFMVGAERQTLH